MPPRIPGRVRMTEAKLIQVGVRGGLPGGQVPAVHLEAGRGLPGAGRAAYEQHTAVEAGRVRRSRHRGAAGVLGLCPSVTRPAAAACRDQPRGLGGGERGRVHACGREIAGVQGRGDAQGHGDSVRRIPAPGEATFQFGACRRHQAYRDVGARDRAGRDAAGGVDDAGDDNALAARCAESFGHGGEVAFLHPVPAGIGRRFGVTDAELVDVGEGGTGAVTREPRVDVPADAALPGSGRTAQPQQRDGSGPHRPDHARLGPTLGPVRFRALPVVAITTGELPG